MKSQKVAIIGAGIVALYLAWRLSEKGYQVTVFEKKERIGKEVCSGLFSERILNFIPESQKLIQNQIESVFIHFPKKTIKVNFSQKFFVMSHWELDNLTANLARKAGAKIILNYNVRSLDSLNFERIIGCDGANSFVRKSLGLPKPNFRLGLQWFISKENFSNYVEVWPTKGGFYWKIPRGKEIEYGRIDKPQTIKNKFQGKKVKSALIPQGFLIPKNPSITLCGDAVGLTKPWSGGGVIWGLTAAEILLKNFPNFLKYQKEMKKFFLPKIILSKIITKMVYFLGFKTPWFLPSKVKIEGDFLF